MGLHPHRTSPRDRKIIIDGFVRFLALLCGIAVAGDGYHIPRRVGGACLRFNWETPHALPSTPLAQSILGYGAHRLQNICDLMVDRVLAHAAQNTNNMQSRKLIMVNKLFMIHDKSSQLCGATLNVSTGPVLGASGTVSGATPPSALCASDSRCCAIAGSCSTTIPATMDEPTVWSV